MNTSDIHNTAEWNNLPIGVFDSGVGGLTVVREIFRNLPDERIIYYGDTARVPYGNKSPETIIRYSGQIVRFLTSCKVKAIVIACNTASALALESVRHNIDIPVIGVVEPGARAAVRETISGRIGIIGTTGTINSGIYEKYIKRLLPEAKVFGKACPLFVPLVEEGMTDDPVTVQMIHRYLDDMISEKQIDTLILGCTHYPLLRSVIARETGGTYAGGSSNAKKTASSHSGIKLVNPAYTAAIELKELLETNSLSADHSCEHKAHRFFVSDSPESFRSFASSILEMNIPDVELKILE